MSVLTHNKAIALTFDDGPNEHMISIVNTVKEYDGKATFFIIGNKICESTVSYLKYAFDNGFELGNHTGTHKNLPSYASHEEMMADIEITTDKLKEIFGKAFAVSILRLPGLTGSEAVYEFSKKARLPIIDASMSAYDWEGSTSTVEDVSNTILKGAADGAIICLHSTKKTSEALKLALPKIEEEYDLVTVSELFAKKGYTNIPLGVPNKKA